MSRFFHFGPHTEAVKAYTMTLKLSNAGKPGEDTLRSATFVYKRLARGLQKLVERLEGGLDAEDPTSIQKQLSGHYKTLQQIVDMELALGKREKHSGGASALDLDAARCEIRDRLLKRARAKSTDKGAGRAE